MNYECKEKNNNKKAKSLSIVFMKKKLEGFEKIQ